MTIEVKIEHGIALPPPKRGRTWPLGELEPGDSFLVPCENGDMKKIQVALSVCAASFTKKTGRTFATRTVEGGVRLWRVK